MMLHHKNVKQAQVVLLASALREMILVSRNGFPCVFLVGAFEEKRPTLTVGSFFSRVRSTFLFICSKT